MTDEIPKHAHERLADARRRDFFTSDLSVSEFLLVREAGFDPVGLVMGTSIYQVAPNIPKLAGNEPGCELVDTTKALYHARELAMTRMEDEAAELGADGIVGVRLTMNLSTDPNRVQFQRYRAWWKWAKHYGFRRPQTAPTGGWFAGWEDLAQTQWQQWARQMGWAIIPLPPWAQPGSQTSYSFGANTAEFIAIGTAVRHRDGVSFKNNKGKPFQSDLSGQDFWMLIRTGFRPVGFVMGNCVYYVPPRLLFAPSNVSCELAEYTHALYDARELAIERLQDEAEDLGATGIVGVSVTEEQHSWRTLPWNVGNAALDTGEIIELFVIGTAVVPIASPGSAGARSNADALRSEIERGGELDQPTLVMMANDPVVVRGDDE